MSYKPEHKHLTVLGLADQKSNSANAKTGKLKLKKAKKIIVDAEKDVSTVVSRTIEELKTELKNDMEGTNKTIADLMNNLKKK